MKLYGYQTRGAAWLARRPRAYLADDCGLGKTAQAVEAARTVRCERTLAVAPASAVPGWYWHWREMGGPGWFEAHSYDKVRRHPGRWAPGEYDTVILDEAHYVKNADAARTKAALDLARRADRAWLLSATPMPNHAGELWPVFRTLFPGAVRQLGVKNRWQWDSKFTTGYVDSFGRRHITGSQKGGLLRPYLDRIMLRRRLEDVALDLPPLRVDVQRLPENLNFSRALVQLGMDPVKVMAAVEAEEGDDGSTSRLRHMVGLWKAPWVAQAIAEELADGAYAKIVVMAYHRDVLDVFRTALSKFGVAYIDGSTGHPQRASAVARFSEVSGPRVFVGQQGATGTGTDGLQAAHEVVLAEPDWTPDNNYQYIKRIHRIGTDAPCRARMFCVEGTLDEAIIDVAARKTRTKAEFGL